MLYLARAKKDSRHHLGERNTEPFSERQNTKVVTMLLCFERMGMKRQKFSHEVLIGATTTAMVFQAGRTGATKKPAKMTLAHGLKRRPKGE